MPWFTHIGRSGRSPDGHAHDAATALRGDALEAEYTGVGQLDRRGRRNPDSHETGPSAP